MDDTDVKRIYLFGHSFGGAVCHLILETLIDEAKEIENEVEFNKRIVRIFKTIRIITCGSIYITSYVITNFNMHDDSYEGVKRKANALNQNRIKPDTINQAIVEDSGRVVDLPREKYVIEDLADIDIKMDKSN